MQEAWFELSLLRTSSMQAVKGGLSAFFVAMFRLFFDRHDVSTGGFSAPLCCSGDRATFWLDIRMVIADESAQHVLFSAKGAGGLKPCMLCANVFNTRLRQESIAVADRTGWSANHDCDDASRFVPHTKDTINEIIRRLSAPMTATARRAMETDLGFNYEAAGLMLDDRMLQHAHPVDTCLFDWMHVFLVSGIFNVATLHIFEAMGSFGITWEVVRNFVGSWQLPSSIREHKVEEIFCPKRIAKSREATPQSLKCTASEALSVLPILAYFMCTVLTGRRSDEEKRYARCFLLLVHAVELLLRSAKQRVSGHEYVGVVERFLRSFKGLFGGDFMTPKFHAALHFGGFLDRWQSIPNCFVLERKHRLPKRWGNQMTNIKAEYEGSVLRNCTLHHLEALHDDRRFCKSPCLVRPTSPSPKLAEAMAAAMGDLGVVQVAQEARVNEFETVHRSDFVLIGSGEGYAFGRLECIFAKVAGAELQLPLGLVQRFDLVAEHTRSWELVACAGGVVVAISDIISALAHSGDDSKILALKPHWVLPCMA